jgi:hypothetical protein
MGRVWGEYGKGMGKVWERYGKGMRKVWERYGICTLLKSRYGLKKLSFVNCVCLNKRQGV